MINMGGPSIQNEDLENPKNDPWHHPITTQSQINDKRHVEYVECALGLPWVRLELHQK